jgi:hypothetical protein
MPVENVGAIESDEEFSILRETLTRFVRERLIPREKEVDGLDQPPADLLAEIRELGLFGVSYPEEYGGMGLNATQEVEVGFIIGRTTPAMRNFISIHNGAAGQAIVHGATQEQKSRYLPRLASGEIIGALALTEPDTGSDARGITTRAVPVEGGLGNQRPQALHFERHVRRTVHRNGQDARRFARDDRVSGGSGHSGDDRRATGAQDGPAWGTDLRRRLRRLPGK